LRKMPLTDLQHTIWAGDLFHKQIIIWTNDFPFCDRKMKGNLGNRIENFVIFRDKSSIL